MKIGIIGIGNIGGTLARKLSAAGHEVRVANSKGHESAEIVRGSRDIDGLWICAIDAQSHVDLAHPAAESVRARSA